MKECTLYISDAVNGLKNIDDESVDCCITSPPYYNLRDYGMEGQIGLEEFPQEYISRLVEVFREVKRTLKPDGTLWVVIGDSYAGSGKGRMKDGRPCKGNSISRNYNNEMGGKLKITQSCKPKDLIGIPWMLAFALRDDGWYLRQDIIWSKPNPMPESVKDRCTKSHEYIFMLSKSRKYYFDAISIAEPVAESTIKRLQQNIDSQIGSSRQQGKTNGNMKAVSGIIEGKRNKRDVWSVTTQGYKGAHFATFPEQLVMPMILAGCREGGVVLDPFAGSGTTLAVALKNNRNAIGVELNEDYKSLIVDRLKECEDVSLRVG